MPEIVFSRTAERSEWNTTVAREVVVEEIEALKAQPGGDIAVGGIASARSPSVGRRSGATDTMAPSPRTAPCRGLRHGGGGGEAEP